MDDASTADGTTASSPWRGSRRRTTRRAASALLTGVGGIVGQGILKCLSGTPYRTVGADASELAVGLYASDRGYVIHPVRHPLYIEQLMAICLQERARYVFPGLDMELPVLAGAAGRFRRKGIIPIISSAEVIDLGDDKLATAGFLKSHDLPAPRTLDLAVDPPSDLPLPLVLKPRRGGSRSQGVHIVRSPKELAYRLDTIEARTYVAQEYLEGDEYSAGSITFDGRCRGVMIMRRTLRDGDTHKAFVVRDSMLESFIHRVAELLQPFGPCNFQFRVRGGIPYIFEINPRVSGGACLRALAGFNEPLMTLDFLEHGKRPTYQIRPLAVLRYWKEFVVDEARIDEARREGCVNGGGRAL